MATGYGQFMSRAIPMAPDDRRAQLLVAARTVFASLGYHRANVSAIIDQAGVARGTFYNYFESKRACFQAVLSETMDSVGTGQSLGVVCTGDPLTLARLVLGMIREPVFQAWLYGETLDASRVVQSLKGVLRDGLITVDA